MKKVFAILAIAGFVACNDTSSTTTAADSAKIADSIKAAIDAAQSKMNQMTDSATNKMDKMVDSAKKDVQMTADTAAKKVEKMEEKKAEKKS